MSDDKGSDELIGNDSNPENAPDPEGSTTLKGPSEELTANDDSDGSNGGDSE